jgi:hypothetical protein
MNKQIKKETLVLSRRGFVKNAAGLTFSFALSGALLGRASEVLAATDAKLNAWVTIGTDNTITILCPTSEMGQGVLTALPLIVAEELDADWSKVRCEFAPSNPKIYGGVHKMFPGAQVTLASVSVPAYYMPLRTAGAQARKVLLDNVAAEWKVPVAELTTERSTITHRKSKRRISYGDVVKFAKVPETPPHLRKWLDHVWDKYLTNPDGTPRVKVHGFGLTTLDLMYRYPWYSVDSTSWVKIGMFGAIYLDIKQLNGSIRDYKIDFSSKSQKLKDINSWHFTSLTKMQQHKVLQRLEELEAERIKFPQQEAEMAEALGFKQGYNVRSLAESYGWRDHFNINYFRRAQGRAVKTFRRPRESLFT